MTENRSHNDVLRITVEIVSAHASNNAVSVTDLSGLIREVHQTLTSLSSGAAGVAAGEAKVATDAAKVPAVPRKKSVTPDYIICLEDGKKLKTLKRHLSTSYALTPDQYREKWGLAKDYPMVAPNYAARRSELAKGFGFGRKHS